MGESQKIMQVRSARQVPVRVRLLDDDIFNHSVDKRALGWILFDKVCEHVNIIEKDYFGLNYYDAAGEKFWLNNDKKIAKQMKGQNWDFNFEVKFYPADPAQLAEDLTRYQLCLQIRRDIVNERLPCSFVTYTLLGSYTAQSELGDYEAEEFGSGYKYLKDVQFAPHQDKELLVKIAELHRQHKGETPEEAEVHFLENAKKLAMFGVELHAAKDAEGRDIQLGVCASGLIVYKDKQQINRFVWPKVLKISYRRSKYYIKIRPGEFEEFASLIGFKLANVKMAKRLWKISVEHHSFFRFREPEVQKSVSFLPRFGSRFRYSGRTQFQTRQVVAEENRDSPYFDRVLSKRGTFGGRTNNMRKRDEDRQQRRDELRRQPYPPQTKLPPSEPKKEPPEPKRTPPEPKHAPPVAPKPEKPKPYPRGPPSVDDNVSLDRDHTGSLNDSFDDVPDRRSKMEKIHAVATPLAALMQSKKEHEQHEEEHHREEYTRARDDHQRDDHHDDDHDRSYDHEVGKNSQTNRTNRAYETDRTKSGKGDHYTQVNNKEKVRKSKSMGDNFERKKDLFSHSVSSLESVTSHGDYDTSKYCGTVNGMQNFGKNDRLSHSASAEIIYSEIPKNHYDEIAPPKSEGIYAEIDEVKGQVEKMRNDKSGKNDLYAEIPDKNDRLQQKHEKPLTEMKIYGRKSKYFKENQKSEINQNTDISSNQSMSPKVKGKQTKPKDFSDTVKHNFEISDQSSVKSEGAKVSSSHNLLGAKPKTAQMPVYAKINKQKKVSVENTAKTGANLNEMCKEDSILEPKLNESLKLKEELKMYILTPEKVNKNSKGLNRAVQSEKNEAVSAYKADLNDVLCQEKVTTDKNTIPYSGYPTVLIENLQDRTHKETLDVIPDLNDRKNTNIEPSKDVHGNGELNSEVDNDILECKQPENIVKVLSLSSLEDGESVHNTSSGVSDPEQGIISELETEGAELDIRKRIESSSLSCLYKLTFDGNSNNGAESLILDDEKLERFSALSSTSSDLDFKRPNDKEEVAFKIETGASHTDNFDSYRTHSLDDDLERFSTVSTDSSELEDAFEENPVHYGTNLFVSSLSVKSKKKTRAKDHECSVTEKHDRIVPNIEHGSEKSGPSESSQKEQQSYLDVGAEGLKSDVQSQAFVNKEKGQKIDVERILNKTSESRKKNDKEKNSFEIQVYDEEPYSRHKFKANTYELKSEAKSADTNIVDAETMDFFQKPELLDDSSLYSPPENPFSKKRNINKNNENIGVSGLPQQTGFNTKLANDSKTESPKENTFLGPLGMKPQSAEVKKEFLSEKPAEINSIQLKDKDVQGTYTTEIDSSEPESLSLKSVTEEDAYTPVKFNLFADTDQDIHIDTEMVKKRLDFQPEKCENPYTGTEVPIIEGSKVFIGEKKNERLKKKEEKPYAHSFVLKEKDETLKSYPSAFGTRRQTDSQTPSLTPFYSLKSKSKSYAPEEESTHHDSDNIDAAVGNERKLYIQQLAVSNDEVTTKSKAEDINTITVKDKNKDFKGETFTRPEQVPKKGSSSTTSNTKNESIQRKPEKSPIVIKDSKVFTSQKSDLKSKVFTSQKSDLGEMLGKNEFFVSKENTEKVEHIALKEAEKQDGKEQIPDIIMGNIKSFENIESRGKISAVPKTVDKDFTKYPPKSADKKKTDKKKTDDSIYMNALHVSSEKLNNTKETKSKDESKKSLEQSFESTGSAASYTSGLEHTKQQKKKVLPGVIHILNPCPSGWIEGGLKASPAKPIVKKKEKVSKYTVSVLDFEPQELPNPDALSPVDTNLNEPDLDSKDDEDNVEESMDKSDDPKKMLENAQQTELLCRRVWKKYVKGGKIIIQKGTDEQNEDGDDKDEENTDDGDLEAELEKGPCYDQPMAPKTDESSLESQYDGKSDVRKNDAVIGLGDKFEGSDLATTYKSADKEHEDFTDGVNGTTSDCCKELSESNVKESLKNEEFENKFPSDDQLLLPAEISGTTKYMANSFTHPNEKDDVKTEKLPTESWNIETDHYKTLSDQASLHSKLESLGLGDVKIDEDALNQQGLESQQIDYNIEEKSDSESGPSETDSESGDEIELACFEMPGLTVNQESERFISDDSFKNVDGMQQFAIDCSFEDVKSYQMEMEEKDQECSSILCECNFKTSDDGKATVCKLHKSDTITDCLNERKVPDIIDDTPHVPVRSNLKTKAKSEPNLSERRVRFEENLPVYKSSNNLGFRKHLFANRKSGQDEEEKMKYIEDFITCLFDTEPRRIGAGSSLSYEPPTSNSLGNDRLVGDNETLDYNSELDNHKPLDYELAVGDNRHVSDEKIRGCHIPPSYDKTVGNNRPQSYAMSVSDDIGMGHYRIQCYDNLLGYDKPENGKRPESEDRLQDFDTLPQYNGLQDNVSSLSDDWPFGINRSVEDDRVHVDDKCGKQEYQIKKSPKIIKAVPGGKPNFSAKSALVTVSTQQSASKNVPVVIPVVVNQSQTEKMEDKTVPVILLTSPSGEISCSEKTNRNGDRDSFRHQNNRDFISEISGDEREINFDTADASDNVLKNANFPDDHVSSYSTSCVAELKSENDSLFGEENQMHVGYSREYNSDRNENDTVLNKAEESKNAGSELYHKISKNRSVNKSEPSKGNSKKSHSASMQDSEGIELGSSWNIPTNKKIASSKKPRDQVTKYTFTVNEDSDSECPKIKTVTYEYVTEYKLNNVKIQYQQNRKTQTDTQISTIDSEEVESRDKVKDVAETHRKRKRADESDTEIMVEEAIEKSVCYPLGPSHGKSLYSGCASDVNGITEEQVKKTVTVKHPPNNAGDKEEMKQEPDSRPMTPEVIDQDYTVLPAQKPQSAMSDKEKKAFAKQEKERIKREKEEEKRRKKEEEKERKRLEKEKKALLAEEKKAAKQKSKQKGKDKKDADRDVRERRDSRGSNDMGREWDQVRSQDERGPVTPERTRKRLSSFEDVKREVEAEEDRPPTPPAPLPVGERGDNHSQSGSDFDSDEDDHKGPGRDEEDDEDAEEVSF